VAQGLCRDILVLQKGRVVEFGDAEEMLRNPKTEYSKALIDAGFAKRGFRE
jgi:ABC-type microcin C transport system duplicated ATPase subunit YejF